MRPCIIWAATRTSSTNLAKALHVESEPFHFGPPAGRLHWMYDEWQHESVHEALSSRLSELFRGRESFKHLPEWFADGFNVSVARASTALGYRHIHLIRLNELARLISTDIAGQLDAWWPAEAKERFAELRSGKRSLNPLDVPRLIENAKLVRRKWQMVEPNLHPVLTVKCEDIVNRDMTQRRAALWRVVDFLGLDGLGDLDQCMLGGGQDTGQVWDLVPNVDELRQALAREGTV